MVFEWSVFGVSMVGLFVGLTKTYSFKIWWKGEY